MEVIQIEGGYPITGEVRVEGAKNSALKLMAATLMAPGINELTNVPNISDVHIMAQVLEELGAKVEVKGPHDLLIDTTDVNTWVTPYHLVAKMRASTAVLGPLLARFGKAVVAMPGGCNIGARKIDMHMLGLEALGVNFVVDHGNIHASAPNGIVGTLVTLEFPSVGATENLLMASVHAQGVTTIDNAAREPEIVDLANMLNEMGAKISGAGTPLIEIEGVPELHPVSHRVVGDRIEAGTFIAMGGLVGEPVTVRGFDPQHLGLVLKKYELMGLTVEREADGVTVWRTGPIKPTDIQTLPYPGFPTDMQAQTMTLLATAAGDSIITENVFENRFMLAAELNRMGADIRIEGHHAIVHGVEGFSGAPVTSPDLRGGAALVMAGLVADGYTTVSAIHHIDRGYESFVEKLQSLGAHVERIAAPDEL
ncbi:UDP-N-acetylglucosamine 1-carboxyvinyltransferase [Leptogranulimonas caecicola]|uniref:UDP-N-acetylglucosamine 1-carboxyvinyltransferase n=2 Tax=Coriobacteriales TaxID=84999 RepID=A0A4S2F6J8_9ACTN|nr:MULTISPECIES: UDP-N-acetylglucosamine 1-carboxyvinyltransferase [Atopobiaceae]MCI8675445.1 UDP-N-acetylglucosamine 1-carboxyvinyltransferase [Atopobiaceae bacterium]TGY62954.1 UDP-N-acetylglucosamine 1-carboxyvinyltransferase [Muricaecibacterium torontonense]BCV19666.1 UDP-N-acetylglucosamine 1-carboxyvinyltransferase [Atopobiaceae bacterium P1]BDC90330.1 UDP-N-acetylglucosamine 1-carboxyvinyltransferase [Leptogranulimonas caecicola]